MRCGAATRGAQWRGARVFEAPKGSQEAFDIESLLSFHPFDRRSLAVLGLFSAVSLFHRSSRALTAVEDSDPASERSTRLARPRYNRTPCAAAPRLWFPAPNSDFLAPSNLWPLAVAAGRTHSAVLARPFGPTINHKSFKHLEAKQARGKRLGRVDLKATSRCFPTRGQA